MKASAYRALSTAFPCRLWNDLHYLPEREHEDAIYFPVNPGKIYALRTSWLYRFIPGGCWLHLVTVGRRASEYAQELFKSDNYAEYLYFHGLGVESAEALAELWHKRIREELGIAGTDAPEVAKLFHQAYQGSRFSFGYPACPNLEDQVKLSSCSTFALDVGYRKCQLDPEQSNLPIIVPIRKRSIFHRLSKANRPMSKYQVLNEVPRQRGRGQADWSFYLDFGCFRNDGFRREWFRVCFRW